MKTTVALIAISIAVAPARSGPLDDLDKPMEGRSMRATSTMREGEVRRMGEEKLNPKAPPRGDTNEMSNWDNFTVAPGKTHVLLDEEGPGVINHIWMTFLGAGKTELGQERFGHSSGFAAAHLLGRAGAARRGGAGRGFFRQLFRPAA